MPSFNKLYRGTCLALFLASSIASYFNPHLIYIAGFSILGVISYDVVCFFKEKTKVTDYGAEIEILKASHVELAKQLQEIKNDASIGKLASTFQRK